MSACLTCGSSTEPFHSFGRMPIANGFVAPDRVAEEYFFELAVAFCPRCTMVQLVERVDPTKMFHENYAFFSSTSSRMAVHFREMADDVRARYLGGPDPFVVEIGSNDGILLHHFAEAKIRHLGIEPSKNVAEVAAAKGIRTVCRFFDAGVAREIVAENGQADAFLGANVMCHLPDIHSVAEGIRILLKPTGVLVFEDPYVGDIVEKTSYDQIYDEHVFYFSLASVSQLFGRHGMELVDAIPQGTHGGSMRYVVAPKGSRPVSPDVPRLLAREKELGLDRLETFRRLSERIERSRDELKALLRRLKAEGKSVVGYGATSKSTTVLNYGGIGPELVSYISDTTPVKQGKLTPGSHIPVRPYSEFAASPPSHALLFAWNHAAEILEKERGFVAGGGRFIVYVPTVKVLA